MQDGITFKHKGDFSKTQKFFYKALGGLGFTSLEQYGKEGVKALQKATPKGSGKTSKSWKYDIIIEKNKTTIEWYNTNENDGVNIAIILQYGHATKDGHFVQGIDYVNPAMRPVFENIAQQAWKEVTET